MKYSFSEYDPFDIVDKPKLLILGPGISLQDYDLSQINRARTSIISINLALSAYQDVDYYVSTDHTCMQWAYEQGLYSPNQLWFTTAYREVYTKELPVNLVILNSIVELGRNNSQRFRGSGSAAFSLAYYLNHYHPYDSIEYVGIDMSEALYKSKLYTYSNKIKNSFGERVAKMLPNEVSHIKGNKQVVIKKSQHASRDPQLKMILSMCDKNFRSRLVSKSYFDVADYFPK